MLAPILYAASDERWHGPGWAGLLFLLLFLLLLSLVVFKLFWWSPWRARPRGPGSPESVLKLRLARGEIGEADYRRLRDLLHESAGPERPGG